MTMGVVAVVQEWSLAEVMTCGKVEMRVHVSFRVNVQVILKVIATIQDSKFARF